MARKIRQEPRDRGRSSMARTFKKHPVAVVRVAYAGAMYGVGIDEKIREEIERRVDAAIKSASGEE